MTKKPAGRFTGVMIDGMTQTHLPHPTGEYATLCGIDGDDPKLDQFPAPADNKVDCDACWMIFDLCRGYRVKDFKQALDVKEAL